MCSGASAPLEEGHASGAVNAVPGQLERFALPQPGEQAQLDKVGVAALAARSQEKRPTVNGPLDRATTEPTLIVAVAERITHAALDK